MTMKPDQEWDSIKYPQKKSLQWNSIMINVGCQIRLLLLTKQNKTNKKLKLKIKKKHKKTNETKNN
jgi:hypothetical protein